MTQEDEALEMMSCARCGRFSGAEVLCARCEEGWTMSALGAYIARTLDPGGQIPYEVEAGVPQAEGVRAYVLRRLALGVGRSDGAAQEEPTALPQDQTPNAERDRTPSLEEMERYVQGLVEEEARGREAEEEAMSRYSAQVTAQARWEDMRRWKRAQEGRGRG